MSGVGKRALDVGVHLAGVLCLLAGCFAFLTAPFVLRIAWLAYEAPRYREAIFVVERVDRTPPGRRTSGSYELQGLAGGQVERYQPGRQGYAAGHQIPVMHNPAATFRDLRVVDSERDFVKNQRSRARTRILRIYGPLVSFAIIVIALMLWRRRIHGSRPCGCTCGPPRRPRCWGSREAWRCGTSSSEARRDPLPLRWRRTSRPAGGR